MVILEVIMVVIGLGAVFLSFRTSNSNQSTEGEKAYKEELRNVSQEVKEALEQFDKDLNVRAEEIINSTEDKLSTILNEKIMGLSEYSQQILEKMENNHSETVFLYDMLNEKEKDVKELINEADIAKANIRDEIASQYQEFKKNLETIVNESEESIPDEPLYNNIDNSSNNSNNIDDTAINDNDNDSDHAAMYDEEIAKIEEQERREKALHNLYESMGISGIDAAVITAGIEHVDHSDEIIDLYNKGLSILDISKMLEIGQGEAQFVIDMYKVGWFIVNMEVLIWIKNLF